VQIAFITLFLGLINGPQTVAVDPGAGVAAVEIVLDGQRVARIERAPWNATVDFGPALLPHRLVARGLDAQGGVAAEAEQWVNLPRPKAEVEIVLEGAAGSRTRTARLVWDQVTGEQPASASLTLDGVPLALDGRWRTALSIPQAGAAHVLSAELRWPGGAVAHRDVVITGDWGSDVATELTAVAVRAGGRDPLQKSELQGRLLAGGQPLQVQAIEQPPPRVLFLTAPGAESALRAAVHATRVYAAFVPDRRLQAYSVSPFASHYQSVRTAAEIFDVVGPLTGLSKDTMANELLSTRPEARSQGPQLADAVAVAGLNAATHQTPRAVVLIAAAADGPTATDHFSPKAVREYLAALGVPLFVWSIGRPGFHGEEWGKIEDISTSWGLVRAYEGLRDDVLAQQIVWVEGRHLPQSIVLAPAAPVISAAPTAFTAPVTAATPATPISPTAPAAPAAAAAGSAPRSIALVSPQPPH
jgi:hypothetical protein